MVTSVDARLQLEGVTSQRAAAKRLGISRNTVKKYWEDNAVPWDRKEYNREAAVMTPEMVQFTSSCLDEDDRERVKSSGILPVESTAYHGPDSGQRTHCR